MLSSDRLLRNLLVALVTGFICFLFSRPIGFHWFLLGLIYAAFSEYCYHRFINHTKVPVFSAKHRLHHMRYHGDHTRILEDKASNLAEDWYLFPGALILHTLLAELLLGYMPFEALFAFVLFYWQFEVLHWATHVKNNPIDRILSKIPIIASLRKEQIIHHLVHHEINEKNYSFTPPYPGDLLFKTSFRMHGAEKWLGD